MYGEPRDPDTVLAERMILTAQCVADSFTFNKTLLDGSQWYANRHMVSQAAEHMSLSLKGYIYGRDVSEFRFAWPATWWDHLKLKLPSWFRRRFPVRYQTEQWDILEVYPDAGKHYISGIGQHVTVHAMQDGRSIASIQVIERPSTTKMAETIHEVWKEADAEMHLSSFAVAEAVLDRLFCVEGDVKFPNVHCDFAFKDDDAETSED